MGAQVFLESIRQFLEGRPGDVGAAVFDKEDDLAVEFVTAASNLRAAAYGIPQQTLFATKVGPLRNPCRPYQAYPAYPCRPYHTTKWAGRPCMLPSPSHGCSLADCHVLYWQKLRQLHSCSVVSFAAEVLVRYGPPEEEAREPAVTITAHSLHSVLSRPIRGQ